MDFIKLAVDVGGTENGDQLREDFIFNLEQITFIRIMKNDLVIATKSDDSFRISDKGSKEKLLNIVSQHTLY